MIKTATAPLRTRRRPARPTMRLLQRRLDQLQERLENLEDLRDLELAMAENGRTPLVPWEKARKELDLA